MSLVLHNLVAGLAAGGAAALLALGLVLVHRATGVVNFAHGTLATAAAFVAWALIARGVALPLALVGAGVFGFVSGAALGALLAGRVGRGARHAPTLATIAVLIAGEGALGALFGGAPRALDLGLAAAARDAVTAAAAALLVAGLWLSLRFTRAGLALRAVGSRPEAAALMGVPVARVQISTWGIAGLLGAAAGISWAPRALLEPSMMSAPLFAAFAAAVLGGLRSPVGAIVGGAALGVLQTFVAAYVSTELGASVCFVVMIAALLVRPQGLTRAPEAQR